MSVTISPLDHNEESIARQIHAVFQRSYQEEARLLGIDEFPPLIRSVRQIQTATTHFIGSQVDQDLAAVVEYSWLEPHLCIDSLVVEPRFFRQGLARQLLDGLLGTLAWRTAEVETASGNLPAISLYRQLGFKESLKWMTSVGIEKVQLINTNARRPDN